MYSFGLAFFVVYFLACENKTASVEKALNYALDNRKELEKVIGHYQQSGEAKKLKAVYFLIANMPDKIGYDGPEVRNYDLIFHVFDSLIRNGVKFSLNSPFVSSKWDSITQIYGKPNLYDDGQVNDIEVINSKYLIEDIDLAFRLWKSSADYKDIDLNTFCEWVLPYRIGTEALEPWRKNLYTQFSKFRDTAKYSNSYELANALNCYLKPLISTNHIMWKYPYGITASNMQLAKRGSCYHVTSYTVMVMRANGLPVVIDKAIRWGNHNSGHFWNVLLKANGETHPFDGAQGSLSKINRFPYKIAKVYRITYAKQNPELLPDEQSVPEVLLDSYQKDVTHEYVKAYNIEILLSHKQPFNTKYAVLCTFDNQDWRVQDWGKIKNNNALFNNVGGDVLYRAMFYQKGQYYPASEPFILSKTGEIKYFTASPIKNKMDMTLKRTYPTFGTLIHSYKKVLGGRIQGANKRDFSDSVNLYTIHSIPTKFEEVNIINSRKYRYVRYISADYIIASIGELAFYSKKEGMLNGIPIGAPLTGTEYPIQNAFDKDLATFFEGRTKKYNWVGLDLGKPVAISKVRYCTQNDTNSIIEGNTYELYYWDNNNWKLASRQKAVKQELLFENMPVGKLYFLKNDAGGKEQRPFPMRAESRFGGREILYGKTGI